MREVPKNRRYGRHCVTCSQWWSMRKAPGPRSVPAPLVGPVGRRSRTNTDNAGRALAPRLASEPYPPPRPKAAGVASVARGDDRLRHAASCRTLSTARAGPRGPGALGGFLNIGGPHNSLDAAGGSHRPLAPTGVFTLLSGSVLPARSISSTTFTQRPRDRAVHRPRWARCASMSPPSPRRRRSEPCRPSRRTGRSLVRGTRQHDDPRRARSEPRRGRAIP